MVSGGVRRPRRRVDGSALDVEEISHGWGGKV